MRRLRAHVLRGRGRNDRGEYEDEQSASHRPQGAAVLPSRTVVTTIAIAPEEHLAGAARSSSARARRPRRRRLFDPTTFSTPGSRSCRQAADRARPRRGWERALVVPRLELEHAQSLDARSRRALDGIGGARAEDVLVKTLSDLGLAGSSAPTRTATRGSRLPRPDALRLSGRRSCGSPPRSRSRWRSSPRPRSL
jgi:hypothetical protein